MLYLNSKNIELYKSLRKLVGGDMALLHDALTHSVGKDGFVHMEDLHRYIKQAQTPAEQPEDSRRGAVA